MLETLDILIGFTVVMLVVSMAVTMITQAIASGLVNLRGWCLKEGVSRLLALMDQGLTLEDAKRITNHVLRNPLVGRARIGIPKLRSGGYALATVIHREELIRLLLDFAIPGDAEKANLQVTADEEQLRHRFRASLKRNGVEDPAAVLQQVRTTVVELEKSNPELSNNARLSIALLNFAASDFLSKFTAWFDQTMDRVTDFFTRQIRAITMVVAVVLALLLQLDSIGLINRLSVDDELRNSLVQTAIEQKEDLRRQMESAGEPAAIGASATQDEPLVRVRQTIEQAGVVSLPRDFDQWQGAWWEAPGEGGGFRWPFLLGILLSAALLSLGAPFWYSALANLLKLRSVLAKKDEAQREERQTTQATGTGGGAGGNPLPPSLSGGERGDLSATG
jgi:hypothetical protein